MVRGCFYTKRKTPLSVSNHPNTHYVFLPCCNRRSLKETCSCHNDVTNSITYYAYTDIRRPKNTVNSARSCRSTTSVTFLAQLHCNQSINQSKNRNAQSDTCTYTGSRKFKGWTFKLNTQSCYMCNCLNL